MDAWLVILIIIFTVLILVVNTYMMIIYIHPDDKGIGNNIFYKIIVVFSMSIAFGMIMMFPLDISNTNSNGGLDMLNFWYSMYILVFILIVFILPFSIFLYESDTDHNIAKRVCGALIYQLIVTAVSMIVLFVSWAFFKYADIPVSTISKTDADFESSSSLSSLSQQNNIIQINRVAITVSFPIYLMSIIAFFGYWIFSIFGGIGLSSLPIDLINIFKNRPVLLSTADATKKKIALRNRNKLLIETARQLKEDKKELDIAEGFLNKRKLKSEFKAKMSQFKADVLEAEAMLEIFRIEIDDKGDNDEDRYLLIVNPVKYFLALVLGILLIFLSFFWWLHIIIYTLSATQNFFNNMLIGLQDGNAMFIAVFVIMGLSIYMLLVTISGTFKCGIRIPFIFEFHVMQPNETLMNSFMFNEIIILVSTVAIVMFITFNFLNFARYSVISQIVGSQIQYLRFFKYFYEKRVFEYILVIWSPIAMLIQILLPKKKNEAEKQIEEIRKNNIENQKKFLK